MSTPGDLRERPFVLADDDDLRRLLAHDAAQRRREREESRVWLSALAIGGAIMAALAIVISMYALSRRTSATAAADAPTAAARTAPLGHTVDARLTEMRIADSVKAVAAGKVTFTVTNAGAMKHEYVVLRTSQPAAALPVSGGRASEAGHVGEIGDLPAGATKTLTLDLRPGHYSIVCNLPGHYAAGMHADLTVR
jgi:uncharacterized cupredoxin-like copper-binding protein